MSKTDLHTRGGTGAAAAGSEAAEGEGGTNAAEVGSEAAAVLTPAEALEYLHGLFRPGAAAPPGLDRISELLRRLGGPQEIGRAHV